MEELSLHILDIVQNSIVAGATLIEVEIVEDTSKDTLEIDINDNGCGMDEEVLKRVCDPFTTGRTTRRVGLGIPLFKLAAEQTGGSFEITSEKGVGTKVRAVFGYSHIDRQPLGDTASTMHQLITANDEIDILYTHTKDNKSFTADTREMRAVLGGVPFSQFEVSVWLLEYLKEGEASLADEI
jgi:anti-sigma regulatory factor (Ser/Thr protein kinase)